MPLGIYKQGQGYWVRAITAVGAGILILAGAQWAWKQATTVTIPPRSWTFSLIDTQIDGGEPQQGDTVVLLSYAGADNDLSELGRATLETYTQERGTSATLVLEGFDSDRTRDFAGDSERVRIGDADGPALLAEVRNASSTPMYSQLYVQTAFAGAVILLGTIVIMLLVGTMRRPVEFLIATDSEMKKVNWSTYRDVKSQTIVVIVATFLIAGILFAVDLAFSWFFGAIGVLEQ